MNHSVKAPYQLLQTQSQGFSQLLHGDILGSCPGPLSHEDSLLHAVGEGPLMAGTQ